jgi:hypothetical protein
MNAYLGEQRGPDGLNVVDTSSLDQGVELVGLVTQSVSHTFNNPAQVSRADIPYGDIDTIIGEDEGGVGDSKFGVRHLEIGLFYSATVSAAFSQSRYMRVRLEKGV